MNLAAHSGELLLELCSVRFNNGGTTVVAIMSGNHSIAAIMVWSVGVNVAGRRDNSISVEIRERGLVP